MSQNQAILNYLKAGNTLTGLDALKLFGTMKLASRVSELRDEGHNIQDETIHDKNNGKHYKKYWFSEEPQRTETETALVDNFQKREEAANRKAFETPAGQFSFIG